MSFIKQNMVAIVSFVLICGTIYGQTSLRMERLEEKVESESTKNNDLREVVIRLEERLVSIDDKIERVDRKTEHIINLVKN